MSRKKRHHADNKADLKGGGFVGLPTAVHRSGAYRSLTAFERAVFIEILAAFNGYNNGKIVISHRQIAEALGNSNYRKISRSIAVLIEHGLLDIETESVWKQRRAREYRLTFISTGSPPHTRSATNEYLLWRRIDADGASAEIASSADTASAVADGVADAASAATAEKWLDCVTL